MTDGSGNRCGLQKKEFFHFTLGWFDQGGSAKAAVNVGARGVEAGWVD